MQGKSTGACCSVCGRAFEVKFRYQVRETAAGFEHFCTQRCQQEALGAALREDESERGERASVTSKPAASGEATAMSAPKSSHPACTCDVCGKRFSFEYPFQVVTTDRDARFYCSMGCRSAAMAGAVRVTRAGAPEGRGPRRIAVFNHKGGTGKTTTAVNLAAGLAETGLRVLLVDVDGQGSVGASLGIRGEQTLYHVLVHGASVESAAVPVRQGLDVLTSNELLAAAELHLATRPNRDRILREKLAAAASGYEVVVLDCAPALSLMNQNALVYADSVLVPVSCDYLSLVGVRQVLKTLKNVRELLKHDVSMLGVLPTFYDARQTSARDAVSALEEHFGERCLSPIRTSTKLAEAPSLKKTIFEHAPDSHGAVDYRTLVGHVQRLRGAASLVDKAAPATLTPRSTIPPRPASIPPVAMLPTLDVDGDAGPAIA